MGIDEILKKLPADGLLKTTQDQPATLTQEQRTALIRKGNELFNQGDVALAQRIFTATRYADGLARIGDWYMRQNRPLEALQVYRIASCRQKIDVLVERISRVMSSWLKEEGQPAIYERRT